MVSRSSLLLRMALGAGMAVFLAPLVEGAGVAEAGLRVDGVLLGATGSVLDSGSAGGDMSDWADCVVAPGASVVWAFEAAGVVSVSDCGGASCMERSDAALGRVVVVVLVAVPLPRPRPRPRAAGALGGIVKVLRKEHPNYSMAAGLSCTGLEAEAEAEAIRSIKQRMEKA